MAGKFEIYRDGRGEYRFRFQGRQREDRCHGRVIPDQGGRQEGRGSGHARVSRLEEGRQDRWLIVRPQVSTTFDL